MLRKSTHIYCQVTRNNFQLGVPAYANFSKLYHPSITILSAAVSVYYIFDTRPLCINFDTQHTFVSPSAFSRRAVVSYWRKYVHEVLVDRLGGLSLPRKSVVRLTDRPDMTLDVYRVDVKQQCNAILIEYVHYLLTVISVRCQ